MIKLPKVYAQLTRDMKSHLVLRVFKMDTKTQLTCLNMFSHYLWQKAETLKHTNLQNLCKICNRKQVKVFFLLVCTKHII